MANRFRAARAGRQESPWLLAVAARADLEVTGVVLDRTDRNDPQASVRRGVVELQSTQLYKDGP